MKKKVLVHYICIPETINHRINYEVGALAPFELNGIPFYGDYANTSRRKLLCERKNDYSNKVSYDEKVEEYLNDFREQAPESFDKYFHLPLPNFDYYDRGIETVPVSKDNIGKTLMMIHIYKFCQENWDTFKEKYRNLLAAINGKEFAEQYEFVVLSSFEPHSRLETVPDWIEDIEKEEFKSGR